MPIYGGNAEIDLLALVVGGFGDEFNAKVPQVLLPVCLQRAGGGRW
jgi:hypothetical protein